MTDLDIARNAKLRSIQTVAEELNISKEDCIPYGRLKAKIDPQNIRKRSQKGKLILVTAMTPTPMGEGKTTMAIGLADALRRRGHRTCLALREPSLGPVFGMKGGATGGGYAQVAPMEEINLHFTGDMHAITAANNLLSAMLDNAIYHGKIGIDRDNVFWRRCLDVNDRALRKITIGSDDKKTDLVSRTDGFDITAASEVMAIFCLADSLRDLHTRLGNIFLAKTQMGQPLYCRDLKADGAMTALLKEAFLPNLVQTLEGTPALIHGGPFANIAHGCNSVVATQTALKLADYVVTEAGFGADLGAEKFMDILGQTKGLLPDSVVLVVTLKAIKYHGGVSMQEINRENHSALIRGFENIRIHAENLKNVYGIPFQVVLNCTAVDTEAEIGRVRELCEENDFPFTVCTAWRDGGTGALETAQMAEKLCGQTCQARFAYQPDESIQKKIEAVAKKIYRCKGVEWSEEAEKQAMEISNLGYGQLPVCMAKTQYSFTDEPGKIGAVTGSILHVRQLRLSAGAGFVVALAGNIITMPGLPVSPAAERIGLDENENIFGIF